MTTKTQATQILQKAISDLQGRKVRAELEGDFKHVQVLARVILKIEAELQHVTTGI